MLSPPAAAAAPPAPQPLHPHPHTQHTCIPASAPLRKLGRTAERTRPSSCLADGRFSTLRWLGERSREDVVPTWWNLFVKGGAQLSLSGGGEQGSIMAAPWSPQPEVSATDECCSRCYHAFVAEEAAPFIEYHDAWVSPAGAPIEASFQKVESGRFPFATPTQPELPRPRRDLCISVPLAGHPRPLAMRVMRNQVPPTTNTGLMRRCLEVQNVHSACHRNLKRVAKQRCTADGGRTGPTGGGCGCT